MQPFSNLLLLTRRRYFGNPVGAQNSGRPRLLRRAGIPRAERALRRLVGHSGSGVANSLQRGLAPPLGAALSSRRVSSNSTVCPWTSPTCAALACARSSQRATAAAAPASMFRRFPTPSPFRHCAGVFAARPAGHGQMTCDRIGASIGARRVWVSINGTSATRANVMPGRGPAARERRLCRRRHSAEIFAHRLARLVAANELLGESC